MCFFWCFLNSHVHCAMHVYWQLVTVKLRQIPAPPTREEPVNDSIDSIVISDTEEPPADGVVFLWNCMVVCFLCLTNKQHNTVLVVFMFKLFYVTVTFLLNIFWKYKDSCGDASNQIFPSSRPVLGCQLHTMCLKFMHQILLLQFVYQSPLRLPTTDIAQFVRLPYQYFGKWCKNLSGNPKFQSCKPVKHRDV